MDNFLILIFAIIRVFVEYIGLSFSNISIAIAGGILPALLWLWFWLREDSLHPEPKGRIILCFVAGMLSVFPAYYAQKGALSLFSAPLIIFFLWAGIEELVKYAAAASSALHSSDFDEPIDGLIYMITAALGFAAIENTVFMMTPLLEGDILKSVATGNTRFIGASLLHVASSAVLGFFIAKTFFSSPFKKTVARILGVILATVLHTLFNFLIIKSTGNLIFFAFGLVWVVIFVILFLFEKIKRLKRK